MTDDIKIVTALNIYSDMCDVLDENEFVYDKDDDKLRVELFVANTNNISIKFIMMINIEMQTIMLTSPIDLKMSEDKQMEGILSACIASNNLPDGSFDYDLPNRSVSFRLTFSYKGSLVGKGLFLRLICYSYSIVSKYVVKFSDINKGILSIDKFYED